MIGRHMLLSLIICSLIFSSPARAQDLHMASEEAMPVTDRIEPIRLDTRISLSPSNSWLDSVTMTRIPVGSLITRFDGLHGFVMKQLRNQCRQFMSRAADRGWYVRPDGDNRTLYWSALERDWVGSDINGAWWHRSWMDSLAPEAGGAPARPYIHYYGHDSEWRRGPFAVTNNFRFKFDYLGFFELNPDPVDAQDQPQRTVVSLDVQTDGNLLVGTSVILKLRPRLRVGLPRRGLEDVIRGASLTASFEIFHWSRPILKGEVEVQWRGGDDVLVSFDLALATW